MYNVILVVNLIAGYLLLSSNVGLGILLLSACALLYVLELIGKNWFVNYFDVNEIATYNTQVMIVTGCNGEEECTISNNLTLLRIQGKNLGVTSGDVIRTYKMAKSVNEAAKLMMLTGHDASALDISHLNIIDRAVDSIDLVTLDFGSIASDTMGTKKYLKCWGWPPNRPVERKVVILLDFMRKQRSIPNRNLRGLSESIQRAEVTKISSETFELEYIGGELDELQISQTEAVQASGGTPGTAVYRSGLLGYVLIGFVCGGDNTISTKVAHADMIKEDGHFRAFSQKAFL